jgi:hypothetical protein
MRCLLGGMSEARYLFIQSTCPDSLFGSRIFKYADGSENGDDEDDEDSIMMIMKAQAAARRRAAAVV